MMIFAILVSMVFMLGSILVHAIVVHVEAKGYERGLDDAEQIIYEVRNETNQL